VTTQRANPFAIAFVVLAAAAAVTVWWGPWRTADVQEHQDTNPLTEEDIEQRRADLAGRVARYAPAKPADINNLAAPLVNMLRGLPGVAGVDATPATSNPHRRIVHFLDWHYVDLLANDGRTDWEAFLREVEAVQLDQAAALQCLAQHHGLKRVLVEGLTETDMALLPDKVTQLREAEQNQPALKAQLAEVQTLIQQNKSATDRRNKAVALEKQIVGMLVAHRTETLKMGAAVRLLVSGRLDAVLPLDDARLLDAAGPILPGGKQDTAAVADREAAMVKKALASGPPSSSAGASTICPRRSGRQTRRRSTSAWRHGATWKRRGAAESDGASPLTLGTLENAVATRVEVADVFPTVVG
jgi:hypothetical protein